MSEREEKKMWKIDKCFFKHSRLYGENTCLILKYYKYAEIEIITWEILIISGGIIFIFPRDNINILIKLRNNALIRTRIRYTRRL